MAAPPLLPLREPAATQRASRTDRPDRAIATDAATHPHHKGAGHRCAADSRQTPPLGRFELRPARPLDPHRG